MNSFFKILIANKKEWTIHLVLSFFSTSFLALKYALPQPEIWKILYDSFLFYFEASFSEFKLWYPNFGFWLFLLVVLFKFFISVALLFFSFKIIRKIVQNFNNAIPITDFPFGSFISKQLQISSFLLVYYIGLYFLFRLYFNADFTEFQIGIARGFLLQLSFQILRNCSRYRYVLVNYLNRFFFEPQLPFSISVFRILFFSYLGYVYFISFSMLPTVSLPTKVGLPLIGWLVDLVPVTPELYTNFIYAGITCCLFIVVGFKTRFFLILNSICVFYLLATPNFFGKLWHEQLVIWIAWFFMLSRCYDVFSIDSFLKKTPVVKSASYTFPIRFIWIQFGIIYFWAGFYKLWDAGFDWAFGSSMINQVQLEWVQAYDKVPEIRIDLAPIILHIGGLLAIIFELSYIVFVFRPKWRWVSFFGGLLMHNLIGYFMYISFLTLLQVFYVFFLDFNQFFKKYKNVRTAELKGSNKAFYFGASILVINGFFGMFHIDSYPFSSYPSYSALIPDTLKIIEFRPNKINKTVHEIGQANYFRWEDYGWLEDNLIKDFEAGQNVQKRMEDYWAIWVNRNPQLKVCDTIHVYLMERPVAPEGKSKKVCSKKMGSIIK